MTTHAVAVATPKIVGKALYLEMIADSTIPEDEIRQFLGWQHKGTKQVLIFPQYQDDTGRVIEPRVMSRLVSEHSPRAQWDTTTIRDYPKPVVEGEESETGYSGYSTVDCYARDEFPDLTDKEKHDSRVLGLSYLLRRELVDTRNVFDIEGNRSTEIRQAWVVRDSKPISVEITDQDYFELEQGNTPQAVIRRINKVRGTLDKFPAKLA
jgi:hypothetical protein